MTQKFNQWFTRTPFEQSKDKHAPHCMKLDCYDERDHGCTCGLEASKSEVRSLKTATLEELEACNELPAPSQEPVAQKYPPDELTWLYGHCKAIGMDCKSDSGKWEHDIALFTINQKDQLADATAQIAELKEKHSVAVLRSIEKTEQIAALEARIKELEAPSQEPALIERIAVISAHRACCGTEHDPANGKLHGYCVVCGVPWPCEYIGTPPDTTEQIAELKEQWRQSGLARVRCGMELAAANEQIAKLEARIAELEAPSQEPVGQSCFVQPVPYHCDRITWRGSYYHLPMQSVAAQIAKLEAELISINKEAETNQKWAFLEWRTLAKHKEAQIAELIKFRDELYSTIGAQSNEISYLKDKIAKLESELADCKAWNEQLMKDQAELAEARNVMQMALDFLTGNFKGPYSIQRDVTVVELKEALK